MKPGNIVRLRDLPHLTLMPSAPAEQEPEKREKATPFVVFKSRETIAEIARCRQDSSYEQGSESRKIIDLILKHPTMREALDRELGRFQQAPSAFDLSSNPVCSGILRGAYMRKNRGKFAAFFKDLGADLQSLTPETCPAPVCGEHYDRNWTVTLHRSLQAASERKEPEPVREATCFHYFS